MENTEITKMIEDNGYDDDYDINYSQREKRTIGPNWSKLPYDMHGNLNPNYKTEEEKN